MANVKITDLIAATTPLAGTELLELVQSGVSTKVAASSIAASATNVRTVATGGTGASTLTGYVKGTGTTAMTASATIPVTDLTGTATVPQGGTGAATLTGYVKGTGTTAMTAAATVPVADISGTLPVANGGTGAATLTGYVKGTGTTAMTAAATVPWADVSNKPVNYGAFFDATNQNAAANTATVVLISNQSVIDGITLAGGSQITVPTAGVYRFLLTLQVANSSASDYNVSTWLRKNGTLDIANSCTDSSVIAKSGAVNGYAVVTWNYMVSLAAGDYVQVMWSTPNTGVFLEYIAARTSPTRPAAPSVLLTAQQVG
jgi:hypothetical protein